MDVQSVFRYFVADRMSGIAQGRANDDEQKKRLKRLESLFPFLHRFKVVFAPIQGHKKERT